MVFQTRKNSRRPAMRKLIVIVAVIATLFLSACGPDYYDRVIRNHSSKDVSYVYDG
jgi:hypothetical protein